MLTNVKGFCTLIAPRSSIEHQRSVTYLRPVCLQPDPTDGSFDYFACGGSDHWAEHNSESSSDGIEVRRTSRKFLHAHGPASTDTDCYPAAFPTPIMPLASPMTDPAPTALHIPTLQAIHRMQQQSSPAPTTMLMLPRNSAHNILQPGIHTAASGAAQNTGLGHTQPTSTASQPPEAAQQSQLRLRSEPHAVRRGTRRLSPKERSRSRTRPQHRRHRRSRSHAKIGDPAATERAERTGIDPGLLGPDPQATQAKRLSSAADLNWASYPAPLRRRSKWSYRAPPRPKRRTQPVLAGGMQPPAQYMDLTQETATAQQPPSRFRPSNYTVDQQHKQAQAMVKPAVMLRRDE